MDFIKKININKKWLIRIAAIGLPLLVIILLAYGSQRLECREIKVKFTNSEQSNFLDAEKIKAVIYKIYPKIQYTKMKDIKADVLEQAINKMSSVEHADVYKNIEGTITVSVKQREAAVRIFDKNNKSYYIDKNGFLFPISINFTPPAIVASGNIEKFKKRVTNVLEDSVKVPVLNQILQLSLYIAKDKFWNAQIEQIYVNEKKEFELVPRVGGHIILLGNLENIDLKFKRLKYFYQTVLNEQGWNKYNYINLKYENQIVCTKST
jgi:cell division protein FtsQ